MQHRSPRTNRGFTLVELLVVIGIIALLISILMPALTKARQAANTIKDAANLRSVLQGMILYTTQNGGAIPGSPHTTARFLYKDPVAGVNDPTYNDTNCPNIIQCWDWASPIARIMGMKFDSGSSLASRISRYETLRAAGPFRCPENDILAQPFGSVTASVGPMVSYNTALGFLVVRNPGTRAYPSGTTLAFDVWNPPASYFPRITKVGDASRKIYIADGARYSAPDTQPDVDLSYNPKLGGAFSDQGPVGPYSRAWNRDSAAGNGGTGFDCRMYWARHGNRKAGTPGGSFRFNAGFFDGHVETLDDLEGANPALWFPKGTELTVNASQISKDVQRRYYNNQSGTFIVP